MEDGDQHVDKDLDARLRTQGLVIEAILRFLGPSARTKIRGTLIGDKAAIYKNLELLTEGAGVEEARRDLHIVDLAIGMVAVARMQEGE